MYGTEGLQGLVTHTDSLALRVCAWDEATCGVTHFRRCNFGTGFVTPALKTRTPLLLRFQVCELSTLG